DHTYPVRVGGDRTADPRLSARTFRLCSDARRARRVGGRARRDNGRSGSAVRRSKAAPTAHRVSELAARGYLLDPTALAALGSSRRVSMLLTAAPHFQLPIYAPVTCVDAADRIRPGIARHVGLLDVVEPVELTYSVVLHLRERTPQENLDMAHVIA